MSMTITQLRDKRAKAWDQAKNFLDQHRNKDGMLSAEDAKAYEKLENEVFELSKALEREERAFAMDTELSRPTSKLVRIDPNGGNGYGHAAKLYEDSMLAALRSNFRQVSDILSTEPASGGVLIPDEWDRRLIEKMEEENIFRRLGTVIRTSGERKINVASGKPAASWIEENGELQFSDPVFSQVILDAWKLSVAVKVSEELLADNAYDLKGFLLRSFGTAIAQKEEEAFINGDGNKKPLGILEADGGAEVGVTTASSTAITADEIIDLVYKLKRPYRAKAAFLTADSTLAQIRKLKNDNGYLWQPALTAGEPDRLLGYPVYTSQFMPVMAAGEPVIAFGDFSFYNIGDRGNRTFAALNERYAEYGQVAFVSKERVDGKLTLSEAVQILKMKGTANG